MQNSILAGPILRRATINRVCVWLSSANQLSLKLEILSGNTKIGQSDLQRLYTERTQIGENLFIYLLEARANVDSGFPQDEFLTYQVISEEHGSVSVFNEADIRYPGFDKPSFFISRNITSLLHGSCRKPHGGGSAIDALHQANNIVRENVQDQSKRPALLLLTGDQIYADDVAVSLLSVIRKKAAELIGRQESVPIEELDEGKVINRQYKVGKIKLNDRKNFLKKYKSGFSSANAENHILTLGEFSALYIYMFGNVQNWSVESDWQALLNEGIYDEDKVSGNLKKEIDSIEIFEQTLPDIRRVLANIPTYMMFDDHDVTDDWNLTNSWYDNVRDSVLGRRIVSNALAAYWAFQGCGNDPDHFTHDFKTAISDFGLFDGDLKNEKENTQKENKHALTERYDLQIWIHRGWGFSVPTSPPIIAIDSRTQRSRTLMSYLPILVDRYGLDWLRVEWAKLKANKEIEFIESPIFITATPVMAYTFVAMFKRFLLLLAQNVDSLLFKLIGNIPYVGKITSLADNPDLLTRKLIQWADMEGWTTNSTGLFKLLDCISGKMHIKKCVFLSGDVHYGFTGVGAYQYRNNKIDCIQLTSSSLKNTPSKLQLKALDTIKSIGDGETNYIFLGSTRLPGFLEKIINQYSFLSFVKKILRTTRIKLLPTDGDYIVSDVNLGLVKFENGLPVQHCLINNDSNCEFIIGHLRKYR